MRPDFWLVGLTAIQPDYESTEAGIVEPMKEGCSAGVLLVDSNKMGGLCSLIHYTNQYRLQPLLVAL